MTTAPIKRMMTIKEVAEMMGVSTRTITRWVSQRKFPAPKRPVHAPGCKRLWYGPDIELYIEENCSMYRYREAKRS